MWPHCEEQMRSSRDPQVHPSGPDMRLLLKKRARGRYSSAALVKVRSHPSLIRHCLSSSFSCLPRGLTRCKNGVECLSGRKSPFQLAPFQAGLFFLPAQDSWEIPTFWRPQFRYSDSQGRGANISRLPSSCQGDYTLLPRDLASS